MAAVGTEPATFVISDACTASEVRHMRGRLFLVIRMGVVLILQMAMAGCVTGGSGGVFGFIDGHGFFEGGSSSDDDSNDSSGGPTLLSSLPNGSEDAGSEYSGDGGSEGDGGTGSVITSPATVHSPEPVSMALFGGGLAGLAALRRRNARRL